MNRTDSLSANFYLTYSLTATNMKSRYRKTAAGFIWVVLNPLMLYAVQSFIFKYLFKIQIRDYSLFLLTGLLPWTFIVRSLDMGVPTLDGSREILKSLSISPVVLTSSNVLDNFFNFVFAFMIILIPLLIFKSDAGPYAFLLPLPLLIIVVTMTCLTFILSVFDVFLRDIRYLTGFINNIMFFLTPVFYPREILPERFQWMFDINPYFILISPFQLSFMETGGAGSLQKLLWALAKAALLMMVVILLTVKTWKTCRKNFYSKL